MSLCLHCDQDVVHAVFTEVNLKKIGPFCCQGCLAVYNVIHMKGLAEYYKIKESASLFRPRAPATLPSTPYSYLDDPDFLVEHSYTSSTGLSTMEFYLEGIHCIACLWIIEKLPAFLKGVQSSKLDMGKSVVTVSLLPGGAFSSVASEFQHLGYAPHPLKINQKSNQLKIKENRSMLLRIGVAAAASSNIMLYAVSLYAGADRTEYAALFNAFTVIFALPVLTYSAYPFYRNSYLALKNRSLSIDVPISLALIMGALMGIYNLANGVHENYFDSLTALVFLLLLSRYFLKIIQEKGLATSDLHYFYQSSSVLKRGESPEVFRPIDPKSIKVGDVLKILPNQMIPADAEVVAGQSYLNNSLLTGESRPQKIIEGDSVFSGTMNISEELLIKVTQTQQETRLGKILKGVETGWTHKAKIVDVTNLISKYFVGAVFALACLLFFLNLREGKVGHAFEEALTLLIVTCPCALAIATPLTFIRTLSQSAQKGIIIKDDSVIEKLSKAKNIFIDKTGTLTLNNHVVSEVEIKAPSLLRVEDIFYNLEKNSHHPVGLCLKRYAEAAHPRSFAVDDFREIPGRGVCGSINGHFYEIAPYSVYEDGVLVATFAITDGLRPEARESIQKLRDLGLHFQVLSGDKKEYVEEVAKQLSLKDVEYAYELSPEEKAKMISNSSRTVMIGDGANDSIALSCADTGIAVYGALDISLRAADVYLTFPGIGPVLDLMVISAETMKVIYRNLILSLLYNSISVGLAFTGHISPLTAAIIMPLSSLTVLISTLMGTKTLRQKWKS